MLIISAMCSGNNFSQKGTIGKISLHSFPLTFCGLEYLVTDI